MTPLLERISQTIFFPRPCFAAPPTGARDVTVGVAEGVRIHARIHDEPDARTLVVLFHGNGEIVSDYDGAATRFAATGGALAVIDFRGYGRSEGTPDLESLVGDARPALEGLIPHLEPAGGARPIVVMGRSLGSACAVEVARAMPHAIAGVIFESGFSDVGGIARRRGLDVELVGTEERALLSPLPKLAASRAPLLVLHGELDTLIAPVEGRAAFEASAADDKRFVLVPGRGHNDLSRHPLYWDELAAFLRRVASGRPSRG